MSRTLRSSLVACTLALSSVVSAPVAAQDMQASASSDITRVTVRPEIRTRVERALLAIDALPPATFWQGMGAEGLAALALVIDDGSRPVVLRRRAVLALQHDRSAASRSMLEALARDGGEDELVSRNAVRVLAVREGLGAIATLEQALADRRAHVREGAVEALGAMRRRGVIDGPRVSALLAPRRAGEQELFVREAIDRALALR